VVVVEVVVLVSDVVVDSSPLSLLPHPTASARTAAPPKATNAVRTEVFMGTLCCRGSSAVLPRSGPPKLGCGAYRPDALTTPCSAGSAAPRSGAMTGQPIARVTLHVEEAVGVAHQVGVGWVPFAP
jgi:hypothetical protein